MTNPISNQLMRAVLARHEADRQEALATIELYLNASVGIGDHPNVVEEISKAAAKLAAAEEILETLRRNFLRDTEEGTENE
mgnify:CR=1 FL=1|tara:strand:- start:281 stop:523 length:243 start_codon:yes stop_codon:yes gene_type:complete